jgi:hypothetical protein
LKLFPPGRGDIIRYAYLWADEQRRGREEGGKDRPSLVLALSIRLDDGRTEVLVLAVTHSPPRNPADAIAIPSNVRRRLGLDGQESFIVTTEANAFVWPGPDIRPIPGRKPASVIYGKVPDDLLRDAARSFLANRKSQRASLVRRSS